MRLFCRRQACFDLFEATTVGIPSGDNDGSKLTNKGPPAKPKILKDISGRGCPLFRVSPSRTPVLIARGGTLFQKILNLDYYLYWEHPLPEDLNIVDSACFRKIEKNFPDTKTGCIPIS